MKEFTVIDAHAHVLETIKGIGYRGECRYAGAGRVRWITGEETQIIPEERNADCFTYDELLEIMDASGVEKAVLMQGNIYGLQNEYAVEAVRRHPDRFAAMGSFDPYTRECEAIMHRLAENMQVCGFKFEMSTKGGFMGFHPDFRLDGEEMKKVFVYASEHSLPISLDIGSFEQSSFQLDTLVELAHKYDTISFVIEHVFCAGIGEEKKVQEALCKIKHSSNIMVTLASLPVNCAPEEYPFATARRYARMACDMIGAERMMWGSDVPVTITRNSYNELLDFAADIFSNAEKKELYGGTARRIYGL